VLQICNTYVSNITSNTHIVWISKPSGTEVFLMKYFPYDRLCGLVVRVVGYRSRDSGFDSRRYKIFWEAVRPERGPLSLVSVTEEVLKLPAPGLENRD
jgi:hypothetical protein